MRIEAGQLDLAAVLAADLGEKAERHDFDEYRLWAATQQAAVGGLVALGGDHIDQTVLAAHITTMTGSLDVWRTVGLTHVCHLLRRCARAPVDRRQPPAGGP